MSLIRPWDFGELAALRTFHRARLFSEISNGNEKKQVEYSLDYWRRVAEANIVAARAGKSPLVAEDLWKLVVDTCNTAYHSADRLFAGKCYIGGTNADLEKRYKDLKKDYGQLKQENDQLRGKLNKAERRQHENPRGGANVRGRGRGGARGGRGGANGGGEGKPGVGWTREQKLDYTCVQWNLGNNCDGATCGKKHRCDKEETPGR